MARMLSILLLLVAVAVFRVSAMPHEVEGQPHAHPHDESAPPAGRPSFCWRLRVNCDAEPDHECCGIGSNQPSSPAETFPAEIPDDFQPGQGARPAPPPVAAVPTTLPEGFVPGDGVRPAPLPVQTLPARLPEGFRPSDGVKPAPRPQRPIETLIAVQGR